MQREAPEQSGAFLWLATADQCTAAQLASIEDDLVIIAFPGALGSGQ
jgi:hypothetical protein